MVLVGRLAGVVGHGDAIVAPFHQEAFRPDLIDRQRRTRHPARGEGQSTNSTIFLEKHTFHTGILRKIIRLPIRVNERFRK